MNNEKLNTAEIQQQLSDALSEIQDLEERLRQVEKTLASVQRDSSLVSLVRQAV